MFENILSEVALFSSIKHIRLHLGPVGIPLVLCSIITAAIFIERSIVLIVNSTHKGLAARSNALLVEHQHTSKQLREDISNIWLGKQQARLSSGIRILNIVTLLAPILGLLGTVIGLIQVFETLGLQTGAIKPSQLAEGLGIAMKTTAAGLIIAIPAMLGAHLFELWADRLITTTTHRLNLQNLQLDGICTKVIS